MKSAIVDVDDLYCEAQILEHLLPRYEQVPGFQVTAYTIPNLMGPVHDLSKKYPWITFAQHGTEHTFGECRSWTSDFAVAQLELGASLGYAPLFKPPQWICDKELEEACVTRGVILHHHVSYHPKAKGLRCYPGSSLGRRQRAQPVHTHITKNPSTDFIEDHPGFTIEALRAYDTFLTPVDEVIVL